MEDPPPPPRDGWLGRLAFALTKRTCFKFSVMSVRSVRFCFLQAVWSGGNKEETRGTNQGQTDTERNMDTTHGVDESEE